MKMLFVALLVLHGLIHLMGFAKAFNLAQLSALHQQMGRPLGLAWLAGAALLLAAAVAFAVGWERWWIIGALAVLVSQFVIITAWTDAKFGTIANVLIAIPVVLALVNLRPDSLQSRYHRAVAEGLARTPAAASLVTDADLSPLPLQVQTYLRRVGVVGKPRVNSVRIVFGGQMRMHKEDPWSAITAEQYEFFHPAERLFFMKAAFKGIPYEGLHHYRGANATMEVKLLGLAEVADARGPEMDQSETVTLFNDMCLLAPAALVDADVKWEVLGAQEVRAVFTNAGHTITAVLTFDDAGDLVNFVSNDRYQSRDGKTYERYPWSTPVREYRDYHGVRISRFGDARWSEPSGEWSYGRFEVLELEYNVAQPSRERKGAPMPKLPTAAMQH